MSRKTRVAKSQAAEASRTPAGLVDTYLEATRLPLTSLAFLLPLLVVYEACALLLQPTIASTRNLVAANAIESLLAWFGPAGSWVPAIVLVSSLVAWHVLRRDPASVRAWVPPLMVVESLLLTLPLFVLSGLTRGVHLDAQIAMGAARKAEIVLVLGAGIYEELVFRLLLITTLTLLLTEFARLRALHAMIASGVLSAMIFAACHCAPIGAEPFEGGAFAMRAASGGYLAMVFLSRGIGVSAGCHVAYNVISVLTG